MGGAMSTPATNANKGLTVTPVNSAAPLRSNAANLNAARPNAVRTNAARPNANRANVPTTTMNSPSQAGGRRRKSRKNKRSSKRK